VRENWFGYFPSSVLCISFHASAQFKQDMNCMTLLLYTLKYDKRCDLLLPVFSSYVTKPTVAFAYTYVEIILHLQGVAEAIAPVKNKLHAVKHLEFLFRYKS
jgi:hypothetical protein